MLKQARSLFFALAATCTLAASAQSSEAQSTASQPQGDPTTSIQMDMQKALAERTCELPKIVSTSTLDPISGSDLMTVPIMVNGTSKQFLLDLALNKPTEMSPSLIAELGIPELPKFSESAGSVGGAGTGMGGGASFTSSGFVGAGGMGMPYCDVDTGVGCWVRDTKVSVNSFTVGGATGHHLQFLTAREDDISRSAPYEGLLTGDFFRKYDVELDFTGKRVTWLTPTNCTDPNQVIFWSHRAVAIIPVRLADDGRLSMTGMVRGHLINAEIDTSSPRTIMRRDVAELYVGLKNQDMLPVGDLKDGLHMQIYVSTFPEITFGTGVTASNVPILIQDYSARPAIHRQLLRGFRVEERIPDLTVGMDVLQHLHMYVVPGQSRVYVTEAD